MNPLNNREGSKQQSHFAHQRRHYLPFSDFIRCAKPNSVALGPSWWQGRRPLAWWINLPGQTGWQVFHRALASNREEADGNLPRAVADVIFGALWDLPRFQIDRMCSQAARFHFTPARQKGGAVQPARFGSEPESFDFMWLLMICVRTKMQNLTSTRIQIKAICLENQAQLELLPTIFFSFNFWFCIWLKYAIIMVINLLLKVIQKCIHVRHHACEPCNSIQ